MTLHTADARSHPIPLSKAESRSRFSVCSQDGNLTTFSLPVNSGNSLPSQCEYITIKAVMLVFLSTVTYDCVVFFFLIARIMYIVLSSNASTTAMIIHAYKARSTT